MIDIELALKLLRCSNYELGLEEHSPENIIVSIFTNGNCLNLALALKELVSNVEIIYSNSLAHYWIMYNDEHYDINGKSETLRKVYENGEAYIAEDPRDINNYSVLYGSCLA